LENGMTFHPRSDLFRLGQDRTAACIALIIDLARCVAAARHTSTFACLNIAHRTLRARYPEEEASILFGALFTWVGQVKGELGDRLTFRPPRCRCRSDGEETLAQILMGLAATGAAAGETPSGTAHEYVLLGPTTHRLTMHLWRAFMDSRGDEPDVSDATPHDRLIAASAS
jgi:hypothetical protein